MLSEFKLIERYFTRETPHAVLGVGDDGALVAPTPGHELVISTDLLVEGTHFFADAEPEALGWKTLAVNVSDMAAMGAEPRWATLGITVPPLVPASVSMVTPTLDWLDDFSRGFFACAEAFGVDLIGGDTTRGPRTFSVTILGETPAGQALRRDGAHAGDSIWISGTPGRAALGLAHLQRRIQLVEPLLGKCLGALHRPQPRVALGLALRGLATAAIDVSDGLLADLGHILVASHLGAELKLTDLPPAGLERDCLLAGGDDYELIFTTPTARDREVSALSAKLGLPLTRIGVIQKDPPGQLRLVGVDGQDITPVRRGFDHFA